MVTPVTNFGRSGLYDWLVQRLSAVILLAYSVFMVAYLAANPELSYHQWSALFQQTWMRLFSLLTLLALGAHCWIGLWSISTDYIKPFGLRFVFQCLCGLALFAYTVWGVQLLWGL